MKNQPLFPAPVAPPLVLSKHFETFRAHGGSYSQYKPAKRVACDECVAVLHEAHGVGEPPRSAQVSRRSPSGLLRICRGHADMWRALDGVGEKRGRS